MMFRNGTTVSDAITNISYGASSGTLLVNNSITSDVAVQSGGIFGGSGVVYGDITFESGAILRPIHSLDASSLTRNPDATLIFELGEGTSDLLDLSDNAARVNSPSPSGSDQLRLRRLQLHEYRWFCWHVRFR